MAKSEDPEQVTPEGNQQYRLLDNTDQSSEDDAWLSNLELQLTKKTQKLMNRTRLLVLALVINICFCILTLGLLIRNNLAVGSIEANSSWPYKTNKNQLLKQTSYYSPYLDRLELPPMKEIQVDGSFVGTTYPLSIFKQEPSAEVDAAWERLYKLGYIMLDEDEVRKLGKDPKYTVKAPSSWGHGDNAYVSRTDVSHRIHCLNMLRKATYPEEIYPHIRDEDESSRPLWRPHVMHCTHVLLQHLMCTATLEVVTYNWMEGMTHPQADFSVNRKCLDIEPILEWQEKEGVDIFNPDNSWMGRDWLKVAENASRVPVPPPLQELLKEVDMNGMFE
ncbi:hypothetical protein BGZ63DRAFT_440536 [Mariannaea sp. PMI_226]|nr:hypothetical protein BGZ63DRAFT_440536 [Mariannaea sp. PMI_226]